MYLYYLINIWKAKQSLLKKSLSHLAELAHLRVIVWSKFSSHLSEIPAKSSEIPPRRAGSLLIWTQLCFNKSFLRKVRSHLSGLAHLTEPAHLHMNSPLDLPYNTNHRSYELTMKCYQMLRNRDPPTRSASSADHLRPTTYPTTSLWLLPVEWLLILLHTLLVKSHF